MEFSRRKTTLQDTNQMRICMPIASPHRNTDSATRRAGVANITILGFIFRRFIFFSKFSLQIYMRDHHILVLLGFARHSLFTANSSLAAFQPPVSLAATFNIQHPTLINIFFINVLKFIQIGGESIFPGRAPYRSAPISTLAHTLALNPPARTHVSFNYIDACCGKRNQ